MNLTRFVLVGSLALGAAAAGTSAACVDVAEGRAARDLTVGRASTEAFSIEASEGRAAVRDLERAGDTVRASIWAAAPTLDLELRAPAGTRVELAIENVLPAAALRAAALPDAGETLPGEVELAVTPSDVPTERAVALSIPRGATGVRLRLAAPDQASSEPFRVAAFADVQERIDGVHEIYARMRLDPAIRFVLVSGDLTEGGSEGQLWAFKREMKALPVPCYMTLGNHELGTEDGLYQSFFGRVNHSFTFHGARFTLLDSASATIHPLAFGWLEGWLREGQSGFHLVAMHIPPVDPVGSRNGSFANRAEAHKLLAALASGNVDVTLYGHVHSYYAYSNAGIPAYISGGGGAIPERFDGVGRHFLTFDIDPRSQSFQTAIVRVD